MLEFSENVDTRSIKILAWGPTASRKTETPLRYFPHVLVIDCEGNTDQCVGMPEIPSFMRVKTKDVYQILDVMDKVAAGEITFPDGSPVETLVIDGASVLWSVRQEVGSLNAEKRARKYGNTDPDAANMVQLDWVIAKRPLKRLHARLNNPGVKYVFVTAREKDEYQEIDKPGGKKELVKMGTMMDAMRGIDYEVNIGFQFFNDIPWKCKVVKVQGTLGSMFPLGTELAEFPHEELLAYATGTGEIIEDDVAVAERNLEREEDKTQTDLLTWARKFNGSTPKDVAKALKAAGIESFDATRWDDMIEAIQEFVE